MRYYFLNGNNCDCKVTYDSYIIGAVSDIVSDNECRDDLNADGIINMKDIAIVAKAFWTKPGDTLWNPDADLDISGTVDMKDVGRIAKKFNTACQPGVYDNQKIHIIITVKNTGDNDQTSPFIGVEFWKVYDYTRPSKDEKGVKAWINIKDRTHGCDIAGCDCTSADTEFKKGKMITIDCQVPASYWGPTTGNERIMVWAHERDLTQDADDNGCEGDSSSKSCGSVNGLYSCSQGCPGGSWWTDALSTREPGDGKKPGVANITIKSSGITTTTTTAPGSSIKSKETLPLSMILRNTLIQLFQRVFGLHKTYPTGV